MCPKCWTLGSGFLTGTLLPGLTHLTSCMAIAKYYNFLTKAFYMLCNRLAHKCNTPPHVMETIVEVMQNVHSCVDTTASHNCVGVKVHSTQCSRSSSRWKYLNKLRKDCVLVFHARKLWDKVWKARKTAVLLETHQHSEWGSHGRLHSLHHERGTDWQECCYWKSHWLPLLFGEFFLLMCGNF